MDNPKRGDIWLINLDPVIGNETGKTRPGLIISNNIGNSYSGTVTVIPITSNIKKIYPFEAKLNAQATGLKLDSKAKCNQVRTIARERLLKNVGMLSETQMIDVEKALMIHLDIQQDI